MLHLWFQCRYVICCRAGRIVDVRSFSCLFAYGGARRAGCVVVYVGSGSVSAYYVLLFGVFG